MSHLIIDRLTLNYPGSQTPVLRNISLEIDATELVVVLGASGCGKTTLLNLIAGFLQPDHGQISLGGKSISAPGPDRGVVFQDDALLPWLNVLENVAFGLQLQGLDAASRQARARKVLQLVNLEQHATKAIWTLSGGMRQRVGLARALAANPQVLLMDEPFGALDAFIREQMQALLLRIWQETRKTVVLITHDIEEAVCLASRLILLAPGPGHLSADYRLGFGRRICAGESIRSIKSDPAFINMREEILAKVFQDQQISEHEPL